MKLHHLGLSARNNRAIPRNQWNLPNNKKRTGKGPAHFQADRSWVLKLSHQRHRGQFGMESEYLRPVLKALTLLRHYTNMISAIVTRDVIPAESYCDDRLRTPYSLITKQVISFR